MSPYKNNFKKTGHENKIMVILPSKITMYKLLGDLGALWLTIRLLQWYHFFLLDELPEFSRNVLEVMRQPLEDRIVSFLRVKCLAGFFDGDFGLVRPALCTVTMSRLYKT